MQLQSFAPYFAALSLLMSECAMGADQNESVAEYVRKMRGDSKINRVLVGPDKSEAAREYSAHSWFAAEGGSTTKKDIDHILFTIPPVRTVAVSFSPHRRLILQVKWSEVLVWSAEEKKVEISAQDSLAEKKEKFHQYALQIGTDHLGYACPKEELEIKTWEEEWGEWSLQ